VQVTVQAAIRPTESRERVEAACRTLFSGTAGGDGEVVLRGHDLEALRRRVWELRIIDAVRGALLGGCDGAVLRFALSKQAAAAGKVALPVAQHALGELEVEVRVEADDPWADAEAVVWWLCPETQDGEIVGPTGPPATA
jgi:predicted RNA binding protein with dsRBD fold (UPF0201 family)